MCIEFDIKSGDCTVICDGKGALKRIFSTSIQQLRSSSEKADLIPACNCLVEYTQIHMYQQHAKAHQDESKEFHELTDCMKLNVLMDKKANLALSSNPYSEEEINQLVSHLFSFFRIKYSRKTQRFNFLKLL